MPIKDHTQYQSHLNSPENLSVSKERRMLNLKILTKAKGGILGRQGKVRLQFRINIIKHGLGISIAQNSNTEGTRHHPIHLSTPDLVL